MGDEAGDRGRGWVGLDLLSHGNLGFILYEMNSIGGLYAGRQHSFRLKRITQNGILWVRARLEP